MNPVRRILSTATSWIYLFSSLDKKDEQELEDYFSKLYPREYVKRLVANKEVFNVQFKEASSKKTYHSIE